GLGARENACRGVGILRLRGGFGCALVDIGGPDLEAQPGGGENLAANVALRRQHQRLRSEPERHGQAPGARRRSVKSRITAAAVSSIERRVTSIIGQLCRAQSRRENEISSATAVLSMYWSPSRCAFRPSSRFSRICTMRSGLAYKPTTNGRVSFSTSGANVTPGTSGTLPVLTP